MQLGSFTIRDILLRLLLVSLEYRRSALPFSPDHFSIVYKSMCELNAMYLLPPLEIDPDHLMVIVENWFLALFEFLDELYQYDKLELLIRLRLVQVVPHGIVFQEENLF